MEFKDISAQRANRVSSNGSNEWFMVRATSREVARLGAFFTRAMQYPQTVRDHPNVGTLTTKLLEVAEQTQDDPKQERKKYQLIVDRPDFETIELAVSHVATFLKLTPMEQSQTGVAQFGQPDDSERVVDVDASAYF